jgi:signal-transduction protein with cAMP-binding, CBS, and nucleotidyltransferase domain
MKLVERVFELRSIPLFDQLRQPELVAIAEVANAKQFVPGEPVARVGQVLQRLYAISQGSVLREDGNELPRVFGVGALLAERSLGQGLKAGEEGACCILISKGHFFRILNEFPEFTLGCITVAAEEDCYQAGGERI